MLIAASIVFALAAVLGIALATLHRQHRGAPIPLALFHGALAGSGIVLLILAVGDLARTGLVISLVLFVLAAVGGFVLFARHLGHRPLPMLLIGGHGLIAAISLVILLVMTFRPAAA